MRLYNILWLEDSPATKAQIEDAGRANGLQIELYNDTSSLLDRLTKDMPDAIVWDLGLQEGEHAWSTLSELRKQYGSEVMFAVYSAHHGTVKRYQRQKIESEEGVINLLDLAMSKVLISDPDLAVLEVICALKMRDSNVKKIRDLE